MNKPIFKYAWEKLNTGDYTDIKSYNTAMKEYNKINHAINKAQQERFFSVTITDKWKPTQLDYRHAVNHKEASKQLEYNCKRITNERYREIETTGKYYSITEQCKNGKTFIFEIENN